MPCVRVRALLITCLGLLAGCAAGSARPESNTVNQPAVELRLARSDQTTFALSSLRGKPTLLFLFATYDTPSQLALAHLERLLARERRISVLGLALQPGAREFLDPYRDALSVDFPLAYDPSNEILPGKTDLGRITAVPGFILLDAEGHVIATRYGVATQAELHDWLDDAL